jgi:hypothetical protein
VFRMGGDAPFDAGHGRSPRKSLLQVSWQGRAWWRGR